MIGLGMAVAFACYTLGVMFQTLPIPWKTIKAWGPTLMRDAVIAQIGLLSIGLIQTLVAWMSSTLQQGLGAPFTSSSGEMALIVGQLTALDASMFLLISVLSTTTVMVPVASALASVLGPMMMWTTVALVLWLIIQAILGFLSSIWITVYTIGVILLAIPFRMGRSLGATLMASSIVLIVMLPFMPSLAIWLEGQLGYQLALKPLEEIVSKSKSNPALLLTLLPQLPLSIAGLMAAVVMALVAFPFAYFFIMSLVIRNVAALIGGSSTGPQVTSFILAPAWETGGRLTK